MRRTLIAVGGLLSACASHSYNNTLSTWVGHSELELIQSWGPPQQSYEVQGHRFLVWGASATSYAAIGNTMMPLTKTCKTTMEVADGRVVGYSSAGNSC